jgi:hypothetical protein
MPMLAGPSPTRPTSPQGIASRVVAPQRILGRRPRGGIPCGDVARGDGRDRRAAGGVVRLSGVGPGRPAGPQRRPGGRVPGRAARRPWSGTRRDPRPGPCWPPRPWPGRSCPARRTRTASWVAGRPARPSPPGRGTGSAGSGPAPPTSRQALAGRGPASLGRRPAPPGRGRAPDRPGPATGYRSGPAPRSEVPVDSGGGPQPPSHRQKGWPTGSKQTRTSFWGW